MFINKQNYKNPKSHCGYGDSFAVKQFKIKSKFASANLINKSDEGYLRKKNSPKRLFLANNGHQER